MIFSLNQLLSNAQALTATAVSTNYIDLGAPGTPYGAAAPLPRDVGKGNPITILIQNILDSTGTSETMQVDIETDDNTGFSSAKVIASYNFTAGALAGDQVPIQVLPNDCERYIRINYTLAGTSPTFDVTAGITLGNQTNS